MGVQDLCTASCSASGLSGPGMKYSLPAERVYSWRTEGTVKTNPILLKEQTRLQANKYNEATVQATYCIQVMIRRLMTCAGKVRAYPEVISRKKEKRAF